MRYWDWVISIDLPSGGTEAVGSHFILSLTAPEYDKSQWLDVKFKLDLDFPNVGGCRRRGGKREGRQAYAGFFLSGPGASRIGALNLDRIYRIQGSLNLDAQKKSHFHIH